MRLRVPAMVPRWKSSALPRVAAPTEPSGVRQGVNSWTEDNVGFRGPMPPPGSGQHRYFFRLYALDIQLDFSDKPPTRDQVRRAMRGHVFGEASLMVTYER